jgi:hypothetical protein
MSKKYILAGFFGFLCFSSLFSQEKLVFDAKRSESEKPGQEALLIKMDKSAVSVIYDPSNTAFFDEDGVRGTSSGLLLDLGEIDFGNKEYDKLWVETSYIGALQEDSRFEFYLDDQLMEPKTDLTIPLNIPPDPYESDRAPQTGMFFKNKYAEQISVFDIRRDDNVSKMVSGVMQGILNQEYARIYLISDGHHITQLDDTGRPYEIEKAYPHWMYGGFASIIGMYGDQFDKLVVWDEEKEWTWCLAQMICAQQKGIPVTETMKDFIVKELKWDKEIEDIRSNWSGRSEAYQWAIERLSENCHKTLSFSAGLRSDYKSNPWRIYDYAAASKGFVFWLDETKADETAMIGKICKKMDYQPGSSTMGYGKSSDGDGLNSAINKYNVGFMVSDYYANGSFWCSYPGKSFSQRKGQAVKAEPGKIYVSLIWSDGDNVQFDANQMYNMFKNAKGRGKIPVGVTMASVLQELNPFLLESFYKNLTSNDELIAGPSGFQFIYGDSYRADGYDTWLDMNRRWIETAGFHTGCLWNTSKQDRFDKYMSTCGLQGIFDGWSKNQYRYINNVVAVNQGAHCWKEGDVYDDLIKTQPNNLKPVFRNVYLITANYGGEGGYERLLRELQRLESHMPNTYVYLLPMDLCATLKRYMDENGGKY